VTANHSKDLLDSGSVNDEISLRGQVRGPASAKKLLCKVKNGYRSTTDSNHAYKHYPNLYENHIPVELNRVWVADITYVRLRKAMPIRR
jgi:hypothetical protein